MTMSQAAIDELVGQAQQSPSDTSAPQTQGNHPSRRPTANSSELAELIEPDVRRILGLEIPLAVVVAERLMAVEMLLEIRVGTIIEFEVSFDEELTLVVGDQPIAMGHAVKVGENFGIKINQIETVQDRIEAMGGGSGR